MINKQNVLLTALRENEAAKGKKGDDFFESNASTISYSTGFPVLDYSLGYNVNVHNSDGEYQYSYPSVGITAGSYVLFIGKPSTSKTAAAIKIATNIVRKFDNGLVIHFDLEQALNYTRVQALSRMPMDEIERKYVIRQEDNTLERMKATIMRLYRQKIDNRNEYEYDTGLKNEFGDEIIALAPTVIILDSIATITMSIDGSGEKALAELEEISTQTDRLRLTGEIGRFFNEILPYLRKANITLIAINQIKTNPQLGIVKSASEIMGMKQDETLGTKQDIYVILLLTHIVRVQNYINPVGVFKPL